jgi:hypothetical protein
MKVWKIVSGIISVLGGVLLGLLTVFLAVVTLIFPVDVIDLMGLLIALLIFAGGAVSIVTCRARHKSNIALIAIFAIAAALCIWRLDPYFYLLYPAVWCIACAIVAIVFTCLPDKTPPRRVLHGNRYIVAQHNPDAHCASQRIGAPPVAPPQDAPPRQAPPQYPQAPQNRQ